MKKYLFAAIAMVAMIGCTGCDPKNDNKNIDKLELRPAETTLAEGAKIQLTPVVTPDIKGLEYTWTTTDSTIVAVDNAGNCYAAGAGVAYITATEKKSGKSAQSKITVTSYLEALTYGQAFVYDYDPEEADTIQFEDGEICLLCPMKFIVMSEGFYIDDEFKYAGNGGAMIEMPSYLLWAPKDLNHTAQGTIYVLGRWYTDDAKYNDGYWMAGQSGKLNEAAYAKAVYGLVNAYNDNDGEAFTAGFEAAEAAISGTTLTLWEFVKDEEGEGYSYSRIPDAIVENLIVECNGKVDASSEIMLGINYYKFGFRQFNGIFFGADVTYDEENEQLVKNSDNLLYSDVIVMEDGVAEFEPKEEEQTISKKNMIALPESFIMGAEHDAFKAKIDAFKKNAKQNTKLVCK